MDDSTWKYQDSPPSDDNFVEEQEQKFAPKSSYVMLIDGNTLMFDSQTKYFEKSLEACLRIVRQLCRFNKQDKMCLGFYSTKETNCDVPNVTLIQEFGLVNVDFLKQIKYIIKEGLAMAEQVAIENEDCLHQAIQYAYQTLIDKKLNNTVRKIYIFTCRDCPSVTERRKIEGLVNTFKDSDVKLNIIGLSEDWDDDKFFKDLQIISGTYTEENYERILLHQLESKVIYPVRSMATLKMIINGEDGIDVSIYNLIGATKSPVVEKLAEDGDVVTKETTWSEHKTDFGEDFGDGSEQENQSVVRDLQTDVRKSILLHCKPYGMKNICFTEQEKKSLALMGLKPGIHIIAFVPISCDPLYHMQPANFVTYKDNCNEDQKFLFLTLVKQCSKKNLMGLCRITNKTTKVYSLIPSEDDGGFYLYLVPCRDQVNLQEDDLEDFKYDEEYPCPLNREAVNLFMALIETNMSDYDPNTYTDPNLDQVLTHLEALACKEGLPETVEDTTLPKFATNDPIIDRLKLLLDGDDSNKRGWSGSNGGPINKKPKIDVATVKRHFEAGTINKLTVNELRDFLKDVNVSTSGTKAVLVQKVAEYFS